MFIKPPEQPSQTPCSTALRSVALPRTPTIYQTNGTMAKIQGVATATSTTAELLVTSTTWGMHNASTPNPYVGKVPTPHGQKKTANLTRSSTSNTVSLSCPRPSICKPLLPVQKSLPRDF